MILPYLFTFLLSFIVTTPCLSCYEQFKPEGEVQELDGQSDTNISKGVYYSTHYGYWSLEDFMSPSNVIATNDYYVNKYNVSSSLWSVSVSGFETMAGKDYIGAVNYFGLTDTEALYFKLTNYTYTFDSRTSGAEYHTFAFTFDCYTDSSYSTKQGVRNINIYCNEVWQTFGSDTKISWSCTAQSQWIPTGGSAGYENMYYFRGFYIWFDLNAGWGEYFRYDEGGYASGFSNGYFEGYQQGKADGSTENFDEGYHDGYDDGFDDGYASALDDFDEDGPIFTIFSGIIEVAFVPVNVFLAILNFEVFGINIAGFVSSLLTVAIIIIIVRFLFGGKNND